MPSVELSRRVEKVVRYPPPSEMSERQRREFHEALLEAASPIGGERVVAWLAGRSPRSCLQSVARRLAGAQ
jgi:hypothetical protein